MSGHIHRRALLTGGMAAAFSLAGFGAAGAQTITDEMRTRWLRDGVDAPVPKGHHSIKAPGSALPRRPLRVRRYDDVGIEIVVDPHRSADDMPIFFELDSAELTATSAPAMKWMGEALVGELRGRSFLLAGHTDLSGSHDHNLELSLARAVAVRDYLLKKWPIDSRTLYVAGFGPDYLRTPERPYDAVNRRVEIVALGDLPN